MTDKRFVFHSRNLRAPLPPLPLPVIPPAGMLSVAKTVQFLPSSGFGVTRMTRAPTSKLFPRSLLSGLLVLELIVAGCSPNNPGAAAQTDGSKPPRLSLKEKREKRLETLRGAPAAK
jgi:hypothetical protein